MGTFAGGVFGGPGGGSGSATAGVVLSSIIQRAYRIAGITKWVGTTPQDDWFAEALAEMNAMIGGLNNNRLNIFTINIVNTPLISGQKAYTVGPGANFDMPRPQAIQNGVVLLGSASDTNVVRMPPMYQMNDAEWAEVSLQNIPNGIPLSFYYDGSYDTSTGYGMIFLWPQTTYGYSIDWYCWQAIPTFVSKDDMVALPPGYEDLLVYCLAERLANLNPHQARMLPAAYETARKARAAIQKLNAPIPKPFTNDAAGVGNANPLGRWDYRTGQNR